MWPYCQAPRRFSPRRLYPGLALVLAICLGAPSLALAQSTTAPDPAQAAFIARFTPDVQARLRALPPLMLARMVRTMGGGRAPGPEDQRYTLRQVMVQMLADYQAIGAALAMDNGPLAARNARRLVDHPAPVGYLFPYIGPERITAANFQALPAFLDGVFGEAERLAKDGEKGNLVQASQRYGDILKSCIACHAVFRGTPGVSPYLRPEPTAPKAP